MQVPAAQLLLVREEKVKVGMYVVLHSLQHQPQLAGQLARVTKLASDTKSTPLGGSSSSSSIGGGNSRTSDSSPNTQDDRCAWVHGWKFHCRRLLVMLH
jgi:hypothetical protein